MKRDVEASKASVKVYSSNEADARQAGSWAEDYDVNMFFVGSEHSFIRKKADEIAAQIKAIQEI